MARVPYFDPRAARGRSARLYARLPEDKVLLMLGHLGETMEGVVRLGDQLLNRSGLDPVLREIAVLRVAMLCGGSSEASQLQRQRTTPELGVTQDLIVEVRRGPDSQALNEIQRLVLRFTDELVFNARASDATFEPLHNLLGLKQLQELVISVGYAMMMCRFIETFDIEPGPAPNAALTRMRVV